MARHAESPLFGFPHTPAYDHTQHAPLYLLILLPGFISLGMAVAFAPMREVALVSLVSGIGLLVIASTVHHLRIVDEDAMLAIRYGPLPLLRKRIRYADIQTAEADRTSLIDGWGIHYVPARGWTYNLWGLDCVRCRLTNGRTIRIGTDDPSGLAEFLQQRISQG